MFEAFYFENDTLFGCYHPPSDLSSQKLAVICPPLFDEYRRCYRGLADLANACAGEGCHVLRFDYYGTGDSMGDLEEVQDSLWIENIHQAVEEGLALSGADQVVLVGVRFGGTLASYCRHQAVKQKVLWDPQISGEDFLDLMDAVKKDNEATHWKLARSLALPHEAIDYAQFRISDGLRQNLPRLTLTDAAAQSRIPWDIIRSQKSPENQSIPASDSITHHDSGVTYDWPLYHKGELISKPVLELMAKRILAA